MAFPGGSAFGMARDIAEGYQSVNERTFQRMNRGELDKLVFELNRRLRSIRGTQADAGDTQGIQKRNRRIQRLNTAMMMLRSYRQKRKI